MQSGSIRIDCEHCINKSPSRAVCGFVRAFPTGEVQNDAFLAEFFNWGLNVALRTFARVYKGAHEGASHLGALQDYI